MSKNKELVEYLVSEINALRDQESATEDKKLQEMYEFARVQLEVILFYKLGLTDAEIKKLNLIK